MLSAPRKFGHPQVERAIVVRIRRLSGKLSELSEMKDFGEPCRKNGKPGRTKMRMAEAWPALTDLSAAW